MRSFIFRENSICLYIIRRQIGERRVDFFVEEKIMVEIKAIIELENVQLAQAKNYLEANNMQVGLLLILAVSAFKLRGWETQSLQI